MRALIFYLTLFIFLQAHAQQASVIKITDLENRLNNNSDTTYIVNFWATWCVPCVKELPDFDSITKTNHDPYVKVILVTLDFKEDLEGKVIPFLKKKKIASEVYLLDELNGNYFIPRVSDKWTGAIPGTLILNNKKKYRDFFERKLNYLFLASEIEKIKNLKTE